MEKAKKTPEFWKKPRSIFSRQALPKKAKNEESGVKKANLTTLVVTRNAEATLISFNMNQNH